MTLQLKQAPFVSTFSGVLVWTSEEAGKNWCKRKYFPSFSSICKQRGFRKRISVVGPCKEACTQAGDCFVKKPAGFRKMDRAIHGIPFILPFHCTKLI